MGVVKDRMLANVVHRMSILLVQPKMTMSATASLFVENGSSEMARKFHFGISNLKSFNLTF